MQVSHICLHARPPESGIYSYPHPGLSARLVFIPFTLTS